MIEMFSDSTCPDKFCNMRDRSGKCLATVCIHTTKQVAIIETKCSVCEKLEVGDILYQHKSNNYGIMFKEIRIRYCPVCGKKLQEDRLKWE